MVALRLRPLSKADALQLLQSIDRVFVKKKQRVAVTVLGGLAIILQDFRARSTLDIDIAPTRDAEQFVDACRTLGVPVDVVTIATTVDLVHAPTVVVYTGKALTVAAIEARDLIKLKLERFYKQDPEDVFAIITHIRLAYLHFAEIVCDMLIDFIGNPRSVVLSAQEVVERMYPEHLGEFVQLMRVTSTRR